MPLSIITTKKTATAGHNYQKFAFNQDAILVGVELQRSQPGLMSGYLQNSGTSQVCGLPIGHRGPVSHMSADIKIPVSSRQDLFADYYDCAAGEELILNVMFYLNGDPSEKRMGWWQ